MLRSRRSSRLFVRAKGAILLAIGEGEAESRTRVSKNCRASSAPRACPRNFPQEEEINRPAQQAGRL
jgi:hypothetical protein